MSHLFVGSAEQTGGRNPVSTALVQRWELGPEVLGVGDGLCSTKRDEERDRQLLQHTKEGLEKGGGTLDQVPQILALLDADLGERVEGVDPTSVLRVRVVVHRLALITPQREPQ